MNANPRDPGVRQGSEQRLIQQFVAQPPEDAVKHLKVIHLRHARGIVRQQRRYHTPLAIRQIESRHPNLLA